MTSKIKKLEYGRRKIIQVGQKLNLPNIPKTLNWIFKVKKIYTDGEQSIPYWYMIEGQLTIQLQTVREMTSSFDFPRVIKNVVHDRNLLICLLPDGSLYSRWVNGLTGIESSKKIDGQRRNIKFSAVSITVICNGKKRIIWPFPKKGKG